MGVSYERGTPVNRTGFAPGDRLRVGWGTTRAKDAPGTPTQSHISPRILIYVVNPKRETQSLGEYEAPSMASARKKSKVASNPKPQTLKPKP